MHVDQLRKHLPFICGAIVGLVVLTGLYVSLEWPRPEYRRSPLESEVNFITTMRDKAQCVSESEAYLGRMATAGILPRGHAVRWSQLRHICLLGLTYTTQPTDGDAHRVVEVIDMTWKRILFAFTTTGDIDPAQLVAFHRDMDISDRVIIESTDSERAPFFLTAVPSPECCTPIR